MGRKAVNLMDVSIKIRDWKVGEAMASEEATVLSRHIEQSLIQHAQAMVMEAVKCNTRVIVASINLGVSVRLSVSVLNGDP